MKHLRKLKQWLIRIVIHRITKIIAVIFMIPIFVLYFLYMTTIGLIISIFDTKNIALGYVDDLFESYTNYTLYDE